jgi:hypothetical protein
MVVISQGNVRAFRADRNLLVFSQGNQQTKKNLNEGGRFSFGQYKVGYPLHMSITVAVLSIGKRETLPYWCPIRGISQYEV